MRKVLGLLTLAAVAASCGGGGYNSSTGYSDANRGKLVISFKFPNAGRHVSSDVDLVKINLKSEYISPDTGTFVSNPLDEIVLTPSNTTAEIPVPSGYVDGFVSLWDNDTGTAYPIGGARIWTEVKSSETKRVDVYIPSGIWNLSGSLKGLSRIQVTTFATREPFGWGDVSAPYVTFDSEWYQQFSQGEGESGLEEAPLGGIVEEVVAQTANGTYMVGFFNSIPMLRFIDEDMAAGEFEIQLWDPINGTNPNNVKGRFDSSDPSKVYLYWYDDIGCTVNATLSNGTVVTYNPDSWECQSLLPSAAFEGKPGDFDNAVYTYDNVTVCVREEEGRLYVVPSRECEMPQEGTNATYAWVNRIDITYWASGLENATATISDLPLPWKNMAKVESFNSTCESDDNCTYTWQINNPDNHPITCFIEIGDNRYDVNCSNGTFVCSADSNCTNEESAKFVVRDDAFVQPLADVREVNVSSNNAGSSTPTQVVLSGLILGNSSISFSSNADFRASVEGVADVAAICRNGSVYDGYFEHIPDSTDVKFEIYLPQSLNCVVALLDGKDSNGTVSSDARVLAVTPLLTPQGESAYVEMQGVNDSGVITVQLESAVVDNTTDVSNLAGKTVSYALSYLSSSNGSGSGSGEEAANATSFDVSGTQVTTDKVYSFISWARNEGKVIFLYDNSSTCNFTTPEPGNYTVFYLLNCTDSDCDGNGTVIEGTDEVYIQDDDGNLMKVVYVDNNTMVVLTEDTLSSGESDNYTTSINISLANETYSDSQLSQLLVGSWNYYDYEDEAGEWEREGECVTFYDNGTFCWIDESGNSYYGNYTVHNGQLQMEGDTSSRTFVELIDNNTFLMNEVWYADNGSIEDYGTRIWVRISSCNCP